MDDDRSSSTPPSAARSGASSSLLRAEVDSTERVLAEGSVHGAIAIHVLVTTRRLLFDEGRTVVAVAFDDVRSYSDRLVTHRYYLHLRHAPVMRTYRRARWRVGFVLIGRSRMRSAPESDTELMFSRSDTEASKAIVAQLNRRGVPKLDWTGVPEQGWPPSPVRRRRSLR